jgi:nucleotide sugar dehydrogenase
LSATTDTAVAVAECSTVVIAVPVVIDENLAPDFRALDAVAESIGLGIQAGTLVILETTVPVGTTRDRLGRAVERVSKLRAGADFFLAFSPERVLTGRVFADLRRYPKIVGGVDAASAQRAVEFYSRALQFDSRPDLPRPNGVWNIGATEAAELVKLAETTYRDVNIALANTFAAYCESAGLDVSLVIEAANSQTYSHIHAPGVAVGGHCIPVYPHLYLATDPHASLVLEARRVNKEMPRRAVARLEEALGSLDGAVIAVLGASYRGGVKETAFSGVWDLSEEIQAKGGTVVVHDPMYTADELSSLGLESFRADTSVVGAIVQADHDEYAFWTLDNIPAVRAIYDGRGVLDPAAFPGVTLMVVGQGIP